MIIVDPDRGYRVTAADELFDYDRYTRRTALAWRDGGDDPFHAGVYAEGEAAPTPPRTQPADIVEMLTPGTVLAPSSRPAAPYRITGVLYQALVPLNSDGAVDWSHGGVGNGNNLSPPEDGKSYVWYQALRVERASDRKRCFVWTVYRDRDFVEPVDGSSTPPPVPIDARLTVVAGMTAFGAAVVQNGVFTTFDSVLEGTIGEVGGGGGGLVLVAAGSSSETEDLFTDAVAALPPPRKWEPDAIIDYHMGEWTALTPVQDPRFLIAPGGGYWPLGVGGWILLGFSRGFPAGPAFYLEYTEAHVDVRQAIDVWIARIGVEPKAPCQYRTETKKFTGVYDPLGDYDSAPPTAKPGTTTKDFGWEGPEWVFVGKTGHDATPLGKDDLFSSMQLTDKLTGSIDPGTYHYMLLMDSRVPLRLNEDVGLTSGGPDIRHVQVVRRTGIHFLLLVDGSRSMFGGDPKVYRSAIHKYVYRALTLSYVGEKKLTVFFIREDFKTMSDEVALPGASAEPIVDKIMAEVNLGWKKDSGLGYKTPLAETIHLAAAKAEAMKADSWVPAVIIVSDGIPDPEGKYGEDEARADIVDSPKSQILESITSESGKVNEALMRLGKLPVGYLTKLVGPWLREGDKEKEVGKAIREAYAKLKTKTGKPLLDIDFAHDPDMTATINHNTVFHTDCLGPTDNVHRVPVGAVKRLIRTYSTGGQNRGLVRCPNGSMENLDGYSSLLDRDIHEAVDGRKHEAAVFEPVRTGTSILTMVVDTPVGPAEKVVWEKVMQTGVDGNWQAVDPRVRYTISDRPTGNPDIIEYDVWKPI